MKKTVVTALVEVGFIIFLFYSNLLMGEYERSGPGWKLGLAGAIEDIFTTTNFAIAVLAGLVGYGIVELLRRKL